MTLTEQGIREMEDLMWIHCPMEQMWLIYELHLNHGLINMGWWAACPEL
jgi:hypothetical protein